MDRADRDTGTEVVDAKGIPQPLRAPLAGWLRQAFGDTTYQWAPAEWCVLVYDAPAPSQGELVSYLEIVRRVCDVGGQSVDVGGIGGVMTRSEWRRRGYASAGLARAARFLREDLRVDFGLLVCGEDKIPIRETRSP